MLGPGDELRTYAHHASVVGEDGAHRAVVVKPVVLGIAACINAVDIGEHAMDADKAFRRNDTLLGADERIDTSRKTARADERTHTAPGTGIYPCDDRRGAEVAELAAKLHRSLDLAARRVEKDNSMETRLIDVLLHEFEKLRRSLVGDLTFRGDDRRAIAPASAGIADRDELKGHRIGVCRARNKAPAGAKQKDSADSMNSLCVQEISENVPASTLLHDLPLRLLDRGTSDLSRIAFRAHDAIGGWAQD